MNAWAESAVRQLAVTTYENSHRAVDTPPNSQRLPSYATLRAPPADVEKRIFLIYYYVCAVIFRAVKRAWSVHIGKKIVKNKASVKLSLIHEKLCRDGKNIFSRRNDDERKWRRKYLRIYFQDEFWKIEICFQFWRSFKLFALHRTLHTTAHRIIFNIFYQVLKLEKNLQSFEKLEARSLNRKALEECVKLLRSLNFLRRFKLLKSLKFLRCINP